MKVLISAGPWLPVPPAGYGGIENVLATLMPALRSLGVEVVLAGVAGSTASVDRFVPTVDRPHFPDLTSPYNQMMGVAHAHCRAVLAELARDPGIDLVHDHVEVVGAAVLAAMGPDAPPALHTLHWDLTKHPDFYGGFDGGGRVFVNALSDRQLAAAPVALREHCLGVVPLAVPLEAFTFTPDKSGYAVVLGRLTATKAPHVAVAACLAHDLPLVLAGPVAGIGDPTELAAELANPAGAVAARPDARYFSEHIAPALGDRVRWVGSVDAPARQELLGRARVALFPVAWEEPGGTAVLEALACGTPVIAMERGCMPMLVEHGVTGFLARDPAEFAGYLDRIGEIDPLACRRSVQEHFIPQVMARRYLALYGEVLNRAGGPRRGRPDGPVGGVR